MGVKILHVIDSLGLGGGAEHSLASILPLLDDRGIESTIAVGTVRTVGLQNQLTERGYRIHVLSGSSIPTRIPSLRSLVAEEAPDVVHSTLYHSCMTARLALTTRTAPLLNSRVSTSYHPARVIDDATKPWKLDAVRRLDRATATRLVDHFHVVTEEVRDETVEVLGVDPGRVTVIPRGRSAAKLGESTVERRSATRRRLGIGEDVPMVLNVGRQDHAKDHVTLLESFAILLRSRPEAVLVLAGRAGDGTEALQRCLRRLDLGDSVMDLGHRDDVSDLMVAADVMAFPSLYEGAAGAVIEAMALRLPVVGSEAVSEPLRGGELGPVVPRGDAAALALEVGALLEDPVRRETIATCAREVFATTYDIDTVADNTVALYEKLARAGRR